MQGYHITSFYTDVERRQLAQKERAFNTQIKREVKRGQKMNEFKLAMTSFRHYMECGIDSLGGYELLLVTRKGHVCQDCIRKNFTLRDVKDLIRDLENGRARVATMAMIESDVWCDCGYCWENPYED